MVLNSLHLSQKFRADFYFMKNQFNLRSVKNKNKIKRMKHNLLLTTPSLDFPTKMAGKWCNMQSFQQKAETFDRHMGVGGFQNTPSKIPEIFFNVSSEMLL